MIVFFYERPSNKEPKKQINKTKQKTNIQRNKIKTKTKTKKRKKQNNNCVYFVVTSLRQNERTTIVLCFKNSLCAAGHTPLLSVSLRYLLDTLILSPVLGKVLKFHYSSRVEY